MKTDSSQRSIVDFDSDGYIVNSLTWTEEVAEEIAYSDGIAPLTESHWNIIVYLRENFLLKKQLPDIHLMSQENFIDEEAFTRLFKQQAEALKIAGLMNPNR